MSMDGHGVPCTVALALYVAHIMRRNEQMGKMSRYWVRLSGSTTESSLSISFRSADHRASLGRIAASLHHQENSRDHRP
ncbi:hypothetical protein V8C43DRAFT_233481 [Trichoderma afarasin]|nr:hypothetical protein CI102_3161 [Trichoderma harzianum]